MIYLFYERVASEIYEIDIFYLVVKIKGIDPA